VVVGGGRNRWIRGVQFSEHTLQLCDELAMLRGVSRSQLVRALVLEESERERQPRLPGVEPGSSAVR